MPARTLVIKVTAGKDEPERSGQALNVAAAALASGVTVSLWLTGESAWFALPGRAAEVVLDHSPPFEDLLASVLAGGQVTLCTQCAARRGITEADLIDGVRIAGAVTFVAAVTAASRWSRSDWVQRSSRPASGGSRPATQLSSRSARPGLRTSTGPCR